MERGSIVTVLGLARSGTAAAKLLAGEGYRVLASDISVSKGTKEARGVLEEIGVEVFLGDHPLERIRVSDFVVVSPGIPGDTEIMNSLRSEGKPIFSEIEVASWFASCSIAAVTGTNGKTTAVNMLGRIAKEAGLEARVCGNVGNPMSAVCRDVGPDGWLIVEVSSYQLHDIRDFHPVVAAILNVSPDHLDRYEDYRSYIEDKKRIMRNMKEDDVLVFNSADPEVRAMVTGFGGEAVPYGLGRLEEGIFPDGDRIEWRWRGERETLFHRGDLSLIGDHNLQNAMAVAAMARSMGVHPERIREGLRGFAGLEHRLEDAGHVGDVRFVNDSKSTNPGSLRVALESFPAKVILIAGGKEKGLDYSDLKGLIAEKVEHLVAIGECGARIASEMTGPTECHIAGTMRDAVRKAYELAGEKGTVLLSPGTSSFDMYRDYEERGIDFKIEVSRLKHEVDP